MARPRKYKTNVPGLSPYFDKRNNKVYWRYRHPITGKITVSAVLTRNWQKLLQQKRTAVLPGSKWNKCSVCRRKLLVIPAVHQPLPFF
ncbi:hypothetical protein EWT20_03645 [Escherichia coli O25b:H4]|nr:hypothetical protein EWT20_03645 [Escherichia coli O25b:H4]